MLEQAVFDGYTWLDADHVRAFIAFIAFILFVLAGDLYFNVLKLNKDMKQGQLAYRAVLDLLEVRKGNKMTKKERQRYLRSEIPDIIVDAFEAAHEKGRLTKTEVNEHYRKLAALYKMPDFKMQKLIGIEPIEIPTHSKWRSVLHQEAHLKRVKAGIRARITGPFHKLLYGKPSPIPGPPVGAPNGDPPVVKKRGQLFAKARK